MTKFYPILGFALIFQLLFETAGYSQDMDFQELHSLFAFSDTAHNEYVKPLRESNNEIDITISTFFLIYKTLISSQDLPKCIFTPSCSEYAVQAFQRKGLIVGWLSSFDRLSRCHGLVNPHHYSFDFDKQRFYDPVE